MGSSTTSAVRRPRARSLQDPPPKAGRDSQSRLAGPTAAESAHADAIMRSSWFGEQGTRLFYMLPQRITDELLPLEIEPRPKTTIRVLVGRMELMTPEDEARVIKLVRTSAGLRKAAVLRAQKAGKRPSYTMPPELRKLGRLAEPALVRARAITDDPVVRGEARQLLQFLNARI